MAFVEAFIQHRLGLPDHFAVDKRQEKGAIEGRILDIDDNPDHGSLGVRIDVVVILDIFDDRQQQVGLAAPDENLVDAITVDFFRKSRPHIMGDQDHRQIRLDLFNCRAESEGIHTAQIGHGDHHIELFPAEDLQGLAGGRCPGDFRRLAQVQAVVFVDQPGGEAAVFLHDEGIVPAGNQKNILHLEGHKIMKDLEMRIKPGKLLTGILKHAISFFVMLTIYCIAVFRKKEIASPFSAVPGT
ncbi:MAG: hypothetical protein ACD_75C01425G0003 [uncultured bacterium]|nr:MAG: hypothetical protein ACD_75C01425G0003 [uncultured bacterium]